MSETHTTPDFDERCEAANFVVLGAISQVLPMLTPEQWHHIEVDLGQQLSGEDEVREYAPSLRKAIWDDAFPGVKQMLVRLGLEPPTAKIDIEMGQKPIGYLRNGSVHLFDD